MDPITSISTGAASAQPGNEVTQPAINSDYETFLQMLTTQMQNQDPLNPQSSDDLAVQLATFSGVEQQVQTNDLLKNLATQLDVLGLSQVANWVGMEAKIWGDAYFDGAPLQLETPIATAADRAELVVYDRNGTEVQRLSVDPTEKSAEWAGVDELGKPLPSGTYSFEVISYAGEAELNTKNAGVFATVQEAQMQSGETMLVFGGGLTVPANEVTAIRNSGAV